jgi:hypothetical protein
VSQSGSVVLDGLIVRYRLDGWAWAPAPLEAARVDGSLRVWLAYGQRRRAHSQVWLHLSLLRHPEGGFRCPLTREQVAEIAGGLQRLPERRSYADGRWFLTDPPPDTEATRYGHPARTRLDQDLQLGSADWMQDWPLEVARTARLDEFLDYYDRADCDEVRHDAMWLALHAAERQLVPAPRWDWFDSRLRQRFPLHAHAVFQLAHNPDDGFGGRLYALGLSCLQQVRLCPAS